MQAHRQVAAASAAVETAVAVGTTTVAPPNESAELQPNVPQPVDWAAAWYPLAFTCDLDKAKLHRIEVLSKPLVVWWDPTATAWSVFDDLCPHRLVPLSEGRVTPKGTLSCGYHGWEWNGEGKCTSIPTGGNPDNPRACVGAYPAVEKQGLLWVKPTRLPPPIGPNADLAAAAALVADAESIPIVPELEDPSWTTQDTWRDIPFDFTTLLENVMDVSHVPWTHHKSISNRNQTGAFDLKMDAPMSPSGFSGVWNTGPRAGQLGPQSTEFVAPNYMKHKLDATDTRGFQACTVVYAVPQGPGRCRLINRNLTRFTKSQLPAKLIRAIPLWVQHVMSHVPLEDDQIFLHIGEQEYVERRAKGVKPQGAYFLASEADTYVAAFRSWLDRYAGGGPFGKPDPAFAVAIGPRLSRDTLLDRYSQHTQHCATCQAGLRKVEAALSAFKAAQAALTGLAILCGAVALARAFTGDWAAAAAVSVPEAAAAGNSVVAGIAGALLAAGQAIVGPGTPLDQVVRGMVWGLAAFVVSRLAEVAREWRSKFYRGTYPPPRNTAKDP